MLDLAVQRKRVQRPVSPLTWECVPSSPFKDVNVIERKDRFILGEERVLKTRRHILVINKSKKDWSEATENSSQCDLFKETPEQTDWTESENEGLRQKQRYIWSHRQQGHCLHRSKPRKFTGQKLTHFGGMKIKTTSPHPHVSWQLLFTSGQRCRFKTMTKTHLRGITWDLHSPWDFPLSLRGRGTTLTWSLSHPLKKNNTRLLSFRQPVTMETWTALLLLKGLLERKDGSSHTWWDNLVITEKQWLFFTWKRSLALPFKWARGRCLQQDWGGGNALPSNNYEDGHKRKSSSASLSTWGGIS